MEELEGYEKIEYCRRCIHVLAALGKPKCGLVTRWCYSCSLHGKEKSYEEGCGYILDKKWRDKAYASIKANPEYQSQILDRYDINEKGGKYKNKSKMPIQRKTKEQNENWKEITEFDGMVESVDVIPCKKFRDDEADTEQYVMTIRPLDKETIDIIKDSKTQRLFNYIKISETSTDDFVAEGSNLDNFIMRIEECLGKEIAKFNKHKELMAYLRGKKFRFLKVKIGKAYGGKDARTAYVPKSKL